MGTSEILFKLIIKLLKIIFWIPFWIFAPYYYTILLSPGIEEKIGLGWMWLSGVIMIVCTYIGLFLIFVFLETIYLLIFYEIKEKEK